MSGKFMKVKRIIIPTITLVLIASQLMGCAAASQDELLSMIDAGDSIEIEVAAPAFAEAEQGEENSLLWEQLALLSTNPAMRKAWDSTLGITNTDTGKNGMLYVGVDGKNENNNTLRVAKNKGLIGNETRWDEAITRSEVIELLVSAYEKETGISDFNAKQGTTMLVYETGKSEGVKEEYTETEMNAVMQAITEAYTYAGPSASAYEKIGAVQKDEVIQVVSKVDGYNWYKIVQEGDIEAYVDGEYLKGYEEQPIEEEAPAPTVKEETPVVKEETPVVKEEVPEVKEETPVQQPVEQPATSTSTPSQPETPAVQPSTPSSSSGATTSNDSSSTGWIGKPQAVGETGADGSTYMGEIDWSAYGF